MAYDAEFAARVRRALGNRKQFEERAMFGGLAFMISGHMCCGILGSELMLRLGRAGAETALRRPHVRPMDFTGRPLQGMVFVHPDGTSSARALQGWVDRAKEFVHSLPPKPARRKA